jgi:hypothetical protein
MSKAKRSKNKAKTKSDAIAIRNALPFFKEGRGKVATSWWNVTPSGDYSADLETGKAYARSFLPMLTFNAGASDLACIVSGMAIAARATNQNLREWRGVDAIALGFMMEIGAALQSAIVSISIAAVAIDRNDAALGAKLVNLVKSGNALNGLDRSSLFHDPGACIIEARAG